MTCPLRLLEMADEREPDEPEQNTARTPLRHAVAAQVGVPVGVQVFDERQIKNWHGYADAGRALSRGGLVNAVSTLTVPPFEAPIGRPAPYGGGQEGLHNNEDEITRAIGTAVPAEVSQVDPRHVERVLAETLSRAGERGVGARQSASVDEALLRTQDTKNLQRSILQDYVDVGTRNPLAEAFRLELWAAAALAYGMFESAKAIAAYRRGTVTPDRPGRTTVPPIPERVPSIPRRVTGRSSGSGDLVPQGLLGDYRFNLAQSKVKPGGP